MATRIPHPVHRADRDAEGTGGFGWGKASRQELGYPVGVDLVCPAGTITAFPAFGSCSGDSGGLTLAQCLTFDPGYAAATGDELVPA